MFGNEILTHINVSAHFRITTVCAAMTEPISETFRTMHEHFYAFLVAILNDTTRFKSVLKVGGLLIYSKKEDVCAFMQN